MTKNQNPNTKGNIHIGGQNIGMGEFITGPSIVVDSIDNPPLNHTDPSKREYYTPKDKRKRILLITDDIRVHSGVAQIGREIVMETCHKYNWTCIAGAVKHPEYGKKIEMSKEVDKVTGLTDSDVTIYPAHGYGEPGLLKGIMVTDKPDAILLITDPRYFEWIFQMENEIRKEIPIAYLNIWDDFPAPQYNEEYYESCDLLMGISKQTKFINEIVLGDKGKNKIINYVPHGLNSNYFFNIEPSHPRYKDVQIFRKKVGVTKGSVNESNPRFKHWEKGLPEKEFTLLFNSRNIRRKSIPDTILGWRLFTEQLSPEERKNVQFVLHTDPISDHGTDIFAIIDYFSVGDEAYESDIIMDADRFSTDEMNLLYNCVDAVILCSSAEGWGLALTEALLTGRPIIANVTGGMQDQMRFIDSDGKWFTPSVDIPSNHKGTYKECGEWAFPVFPAVNSIQGSVPTPYIYDDRCRPEDIAEQIMTVYKLSPEERKRRGKAGSDWARSEEAGFTHYHQGKRIIENFDKLFETWKPRERFEFVKDTDYKKRVLRHKLVY